MLLAYYKLDGDIQDSSGNGYHGSITGGRFVGGIDKHGVSLGGGETITLPKEALGTTTGSIAISFWATIPKPHNGAVCRQSDDGGGYNINIHFPYYSNYNIYWDCADNRINQAIGTKYIGDGIIHHWVFQLNASNDTQQIYLDGVLWHSGTGKTNNFVSSNQPFYFGYFDAVNNYWAGTLDDIRIYDTALSDTEVKTIFDEFNSDILCHLPFPVYNNFVDFGPRNHRVYNRGVYNGDGKVSKYAAYFDGDTSTYLNVDLQTKPEPPVTWSAWVMKNKHTVTSYPIFMSFGLPYMACSSSTSPFRFSYRDSGGQKNCSGTTIPVLNQWYHVCGVFSETDVKIYIDGVLEGTAPTPSLTFDATDFDIGRHRSTDTYRIWGRVDDVRMYNRVLSQQEIDVLVNPDLDNTAVSLNNNGDYITKDLEEEYEWELLDNFQSANLDSGVTSFDTAIGGNNITNLAGLNAAGWTSYVGSFDITSYTRKKGYLQMYYSGSPTGYIQKALPEGYDRFRVKWGNWYSGSATFRIDGVSKQYLGGNYKSNTYEDDYTGTPTIRFEEGGIFWVSEVWVGKKKSGFSIKKEKQSSDIVNNRISINEHGYSSWNLGSGTVGLFNANGTSAENVRVIHEDPFDYGSLVWECRPEAASGADGGWNHSSGEVNQASMYRYSVWVKRNSTTDGRFYHGTNGYNSAGTNIGCRYIDATTTTTNPYFFHGISEMTANTWFLVVGHVWAYGTPVTVSHPNSGIWTKYGKFLDIHRDYVWLNSTAKGRGRTYLYYSTNTAQRQWLCYPLWEKIDGTEATLNDLLTGKAYQQYGMVPEENINMEGLVHRIKDNKLYIDGKLIIK